MANVTVDAVDLETIIQAAYFGPRSTRIEALNLFRVENGKDEIKSQTEIGHVTVDAFSNAVTAVSGAMSA